MPEKESKKEKAADKKSGQESQWGKTIYFDPRVGFVCHSSLSKQEEFLQWNKGK